MSSEENLECKENTNIHTKELLEALRSTLGGQCSEEEVQRKIRSFGLSPDREYQFIDTVKRTTFAPSSMIMGSSEDDYEKNWIEALRQLAEGLQDDEALQIIAAAKKSVLAAHSSPARDMNNNIVDASSTSFRSIIAENKQEQKQKEEEILKILNELKLEDSPAPIGLSQDGSTKVEEQSKQA